MSKNIKYLYKIKIIKIKLSKLIINLKIN
jgi:hypothetical protein